MIRYGLSSLATLYLLLSLAAPVLSRDLAPSDLEHLLSLPRADLPRALPPRTLMRGPVLEIAACPGGLLVVETRGVRRFDPRGREVWSVPVPEGIRRHAIPRSGAWVAGHSVSRSPDGMRRVSDWILDSRDGSRRVLAREQHPSSQRRTDRKLLAWDPLPFLADIGDEEVRVLPVDSPAPPPPTPDPSPRSGIGYRRDHKTLAFLLEEGLLAFRTTDFVESGRSWWSLYHFVPGTGLGSKICDGTPGFLPEELASLRAHPSSGEGFLLERGGRTTLLDPRECRFLPLDEAADLNPESESSRTIGEVYHLERGGTEGGVSLVHPGGRRTLALGGHTLRQLVRVPGTTLLFALEETRKRSLLPDDRIRTLHLLDLGATGEHLRASQAARSFQESVNHALAWIESFHQLPLDKAVAECRQLGETLGAPAPDERLERQARRALGQARDRVARRLIHAGRVQAARELLAEETREPGLLTRIRLDLRKFPEHLEKDLEVARELRERGPTSLELEVEYLRLLIRSGQREEAHGALERAARGVGTHQPLAAMAVLLGDLALRGEDQERAVRAYQLAVRLKPTSEGAANKLIRALEEAGRGCEAAEVLARRSRSDPDSAPGGPRARLFQLYLSCGDRESARAVLDSLRLDRPLNLQYLEWDADLLVAEGHPELARPKLRALLRLSPGSPRLREKLGALHPGPGSREP